ncbi:Interferon-induced GTP-binding protein Mx2, partial [Galemys pyrenaicus]
GRGTSQGSPSRAAASARCPLLPGSHRPTAARLLGPPPPPTPRTPHPTQLNTTPGPPLPSPTPTHAPSPTPAPPTPALHPTPATSSTLVPGVAAIPKAKAPKPGCPLQGSKNSLFSHYEEKVRPCIDLIDSLRALGVEQDLALPAIAVIGDQSSGKSSVLEALSGVALPRGSGIVTRCPLVLTLKKQLQGALWSGTIRYGQVWLHLQDPSQVEQEIRKAQDLIAGQGVGISHELITLEVTSPEVPNLTLIDLPGIARVAVGNQPPDIGVQIKNLIRKYIQRQQTINLVVVPCNVDIATTEALSMAREVDPDGDRTLGILTKPDLVDRGAEDSVLAVAQNFTYHLKKGYMMVKCRGQQDIMNRLSLAQATQKEVTFFQAHPQFRALLDEGKATVPHLAERLTRELISHITKSLPSLEKQIRKSHQQATEELRQCGASIPTSENDRMLFLIQKIKEFNRDIEKLIEGEEIVKNKETRLFNKVRTEFKNWDGVLTSNIQKVKGIMNDEVSRYEKQYRGKELPGFVNYKTFEIIVQQYMEQLVEPALAMLRSIVEIVEQSFTNIAKENFGAFFNLNQIIQESHVQRSNGSEAVDTSGEWEGRRERFLLLSNQSKIEAIKEKQAAMAENMIQLQFKMEQLVYCEDGIYGRVLSQVRGEVFCPGTTALFSNSRSLKMEPPSSKADAPISSFTEIGVHLNAYFLVSVQGHMWEAFGWPLLQPRAPHSWSRRDAADPARAASLASAALGPAPDILTVSRAPSTLPARCSRVTLHPSENPKASPAPAELRPGVSSSPLSPQEASKRLANQVPLIISYFVLKENSSCLQHMDKDKSMTGVSAAGPDLALNGEADVENKEQKPENSLYSHYEEKVRPCIDLIDSLRALGMEQDLALPAITVIGDQSSGKSSVLEALSGVALPRGSGMVTRCPLVLRLKKLMSKDSWRGKVSYQGIEIEISDASEVEQEVNKAQNVVAGEGLGISSQLIVLEISSPEVPDLMLIDLPGITRVAVGNQPPDIGAQIKSLIRKYIQRLQTINLVAVPCNVDIATTEALSMARERALARRDPDQARPGGQRHRRQGGGRGQKLHLPPEEGLHGRQVPRPEGHRRPAEPGPGAAERAGLLRGTLPLQVRGLPGRGGRRAGSGRKGPGRSPGTVWKASSREKGRGRGVLMEEGKATIPKLADRLTSELITHICKSLPMLESQVKESHQEVTEGLLKYGVDIPEEENEKLLFLIEKIRAFNEDLATVTEGEESVKSSEMRLFTKVRQEFNKWSVLVGHSFERDHQDIRKEMTRFENQYRGRELPGFVNYKTFETIVWRQVKALEEPAIQMLHRVAAGPPSVDFADTPFPNSPTKIEDIKSEQEREAERCIRLHFQMESIIYCQDRDYRVALQEVPQQEMEEEQQKKARESAMDEIFEHLAAYHQEASRRLSSHIPLIIQFYMLRSFARQLQNSMLLLLQDKDSYDQLLRERSDTSDRRRHLKEKLARLSQALRELGKFPR